MNSPSPRALRGSALLLLAGVLAACGTGDGPLGVIPQPPAPATVQVEPTTLSFTGVGQAADLEVTVLASDGTPLPDAQLGFASSNAAVASVDGAGRVTSTGTGNALVTVSAGAVTTEVTVTVVPGP